MNRKIGMFFFLSLFLLTAGCRSTQTRETKQAYTFVITFIKDYIQELNPYMQEVYYRMSGQEDFIESYIIESEPQGNANVTIEHKVLNPSPEKQEQDAEIIIVTKFDNYRLSDLVMDTMSDMTMYLISMTTSTERIISLKMTGTLNYSGKITGNGNFDFSVTLREELDGIDKGEPEISGYFKINGKEMDIEKMLEILP